MEGLTSAPRRSESNQHILVATNGRLPRRLSQHLDLTRLLLWSTRLNARLLRNERRQALQIPTTFVVLGLVTLAIEPLQGRESLDTKSLSKISMFVRINLSHSHLVLGELESLSELLIDGCEVLAVATPRGEEFNKSGLSGLEDDIVEVLGK